MRMGIGAEEAPKSQEEERHSVDAIAARRSYLLIFKGQILGREWSE
jgi:hypothetical protein